MALGGDKGVVNSPEPSKPHPRPLPNREGRQGGGYRRGIEDTEGVFKVFSLEELPMGRVLGFSPRQVANGKVFGIFNNKDMKEFSTAEVLIFGTNVLFVLTFLIIEACWFVSDLKKKADANHA